MAKASSSKKVQRAARAASSSRGASERRQLGFPLVVALVLVLGVFLVIFARGSRDPLTSPTTEDHWHSAYTTYNCGEPMQPFRNQITTDGIHSHNADSVIHIHPYNSSATGEDARLGVFFDAMDAAIEVDGIFADNGEFAPILAEDGCDGEPGVIKVARWDLQTSGDHELIEVYEDDFDDIRLLGDGEGFSFALVAVGDDPPPPAQAVVTYLRRVGTEFEPLEPDPLTTTTLAPLSEDTEGDVPDDVEDVEESDGSDG